MNRSLPARIAALAVAAGLLMTTGLTASGLAFDSGNWLDEAKLAAIFKGQSLDGEYASGRKFSETYEANGKLDYRDDMHTSGGHWSISSGTFCTIYDDDPAGGCFRVQQIGANCFEFFFVARTEDKAPGPPGSTPAWTARAWLADRASTCKERVGV